MSDTFFPFFSAGEIYRVTLEDADGDGIPDAGEFGALRAGENDRLHDSDQDGVSNAAEHFFGSAADAPERVPSLPAMVPVSPNSASLAVLFPTKPGTLRHRG